MSKIIKHKNWVQIGHYEDIIVSSLPGIIKLTINRPRVRNAFTPKTIQELQAAFTVANNDNSVGVIILTGMGDLAFCSGGDQSIRGHDGYKDEIGNTHLNVLEFQRQIRVCPKPVIAMVAGYAIGGGHVLHMVCDLTVAAENAVFGQTGPKVGSFDGGYGASYMARIVGQKKAREIWFLCRQYNAQQALDMGLVNEVVSLESLEQATLKMCDEILAHSPLALRCLKAGLNADCDGQTGLQQLAGDATMLFYMTDEAKEGKNAFLEKRKPNFRNVALNADAQLYFHYSKCSKSRQGLAALQENNIKMTVIDYFTQGITKEQSEKIVASYAGDLSDLIRLNDLKKDGLSTPDLTHESYCQFIHQNPKYIQRPILLSHSKTVIGRPTDKLLI
eukprot:COSAG01_NODE_14_length_41020_cov_40.702133_19_plen_389_part_00